MDVPSEFMFKKQYADHAEMEKVYEGAAASLEEAKAAKAASTFVFSNPEKLK